MKKTNFMEKISILTLSFVLTSVVVISGTLPYLPDLFKNRSAQDIGFLLTIPSGALLIIVALTPLIAKYFTERTVITAGLTIIGICGTIPMFSSNYHVILGSRILLGVGLGLINSRAITIIGQRYEGDERRRLLGLRAAVEPLESSIMTMLVAQILPFGWRYSYLVYSIAIILLFLYLVFVPKKANEEKNEKTAKVGMNPAEVLFILKQALLGLILVSVAVAIAIRIPNFVIEKSLGTPVFGNMLLSLTLFAGFVSGSTFAPLVKLFKNFFLVFFMMMIVLSLYLFCSKINTPVLYSSSFLFWICKY